MDEKAQVSAELLIITAAIIAVAIILITQLQHTAEKGKNTLAEKSDKVFNEIENIT